MDTQGSTPSPALGSEGSQASKSLSAPSAASPVSSQSQPPPSLLRQLIDGALVVAVVAIIATHLPWCLTMYEKGDWKPVAGAALTLFFLAARASPQDVVNLATRFLPGRSGGDGK